MTATEPMLNLVGGNTELGGSKLKNGKGKSKPNCELGPSRALLCRRLSRNCLKFHGQIYCRVWKKVWGSTPGEETPATPDEVDAVDAGGVV